MFQKLTVYGLQWKKTSKFDEKFIKSYDVKGQCTNKVLKDTRTLKQALNHGLIFKNVHKEIKSNQKAWLKSYIDLNTRLWTETKSNFEKKCFLANE